MKFFRTITSAVLLLMLGVTASAQATLSRLEEDITRGGGIYHSYEFDEIDDTAAPKGYRPFYISHYGRHGCRYHFLPYFFGSLEKNLHHADSLDNLTPDGSLLLRQVDSILVEHEEMLGNLTARGQREHKLIAERMSDRFPAVFNDKERNLVDAYSSIIRRCIMSMAASTATLMQCNPTLELNLHSDDRIYKYLNLGKQSRVNAEYYDSYMNEELKKAVDWSKVAARVYKDPSRAMGDPFDLGYDIWNFWSICQCIETVNIDILKYMTLEELAESYRIRSGYAYLKHIRSDVFGEKNADESAPLLRDFVTKADEALAGNKVAATLRYGHDATLMPLAAAMGLKDFSRTHTMNDLPADYWDLGSKIGMASNLQMVFYKNRKDDIIVKFLYNEKETTVPALEPVYAEIYYRWSDVRNLFMSRL